MIDINKKSDILKKNSYWISETEWKQPPVPIKHGDLVDIEHNGSTVLGRYIGKGYGAAIIYEIRKDIPYIGKVVSRGLDRNPKLLTDDQLLNFIKD